MVEGRLDEAAEILTHQRMIGGDRIAAGGAAAMLEPAAPGGDMADLLVMDELEDAGESLENYGFKVITIKDEIRKQMIQIAIKYDLSIYDASYLGVSIGLEKVFCTADEKIIKKLPPTLKKKVKSLKNVEEIFR